jgi:phytoene synthase
MVSTAPRTELSAAYDECEQLARSHPENFPVASWLLPRRLRRHVAAIYAFARTADDFADEPGREAAERLELLDEWQRRLRGDQSPPSLFAALDHTRRQFSLPLELFEDLLSAFRQDVVKTRYASWDELFDYCRRSANPVGRLVLRLFGYNNPELDRYSDAVCTALQLTNFWQDFATDWRRGRLYLPSEEWCRTGASTTDLDAGRISEPWQAALTGAASRTRQLFAAGRPIADCVNGRLRYELRATWLGGTRILERIERADFDVVNHRPALRLPDGLVIAWRTVRWRNSQGDRGVR